MSNSESADERADGQVNSRCCRSHSGPAKENQQAICVYVAYCRMMSAGPPTLGDLSRNIRNNVHMIQTFSNQGHATYPKVPSKKEHLNLVQKCANVKTGPTS